MMLFRVSKNILVVLLFFVGFTSYAQNVVVKQEQKVVQPQANLSTTNLPSDFPVYVDTGNPEKDVATYKKAKLVWIQANPERYKNLFKVSDNDTTVTERKAVNRISGGN